MRNTIKTFNPATGQKIESYRTHSPKETDLIVQQAHSAWKNWKDLPLASRCEHMLSLEKVLVKKREEYARLITLEMGKIYSEAIGEIDKVAMYCRFYAREAPRILADEKVSLEQVSHAQISFEALGVLLAIMPWNVPFWQAMRFAIPAIIAGNTVLLKHASNVTGCSLALEKAFLDAGFPQHVFQSVLLQGAETEPLISHPLVKGVTITGSEQAGSRVAMAAGKSLKKSVLELGGSDAFIVLEDADMQACAPKAFQARFANCGQVCISAKRFLVHEEKLEEFIQLQKRLAEQQIIGDPSEKTTTYGPMVSEKALQEIDRQVQESVRMGARIVYGGHRINRQGCYYAPTILRDVTPDMPVFREETFGPIMAITKIADEDEAVRLANDSDYGLGGNIWTQDIERGIQLSRRIESGSVFINSFTQSIPALPFGGIKKSGYGREMSHYGIKEFMNIKTIVVG
ncbi:MAG: NAD-dependent succinate-semialdehyde dehydrogenase [Cytophagales bacterium]|nr:NAD-dependent succinate-semialdehyde dehydrogenase [Cytophagales bacterium]